MKTYFVNSDYEETLYSKFPLKTISNKKNQQLEFFAWILGHSQIYSTRKYSNDYLAFLEDITDDEKKTILESKDVVHYWGNVTETQMMRNLNSKVVSTNFALKNFLCPKNVSIRKAPFNLEDNYIAKSPFSFSGRGHSLGPRLIEREGSYIVEPLLKRTLDFSALCFKDKTIFYLNDVDEKFQYKGTLISFKNDGPYFLSDELKNKYLSDVQVIRKEFDCGLEFEESYSIDSFLYEDDGEKLYSLCEINFRSTMGKMAYLLSKKFFQASKYHYLGIFPNKPLCRIGENYLHLSSDDNFLHLVFIGADSPEEVEFLKKNLAI